MSGRHIEIEVNSLGSRGDGIAETDMGRIYIPYAAPGDFLRIKFADKSSSPIRGEIVERLKDGPGRQEPLCSHFSHCGGCAVQHLIDADYVSWKSALVAKALSHRGINPTMVGETVSGRPGRRRRTRLHVRWTARGLVMGYLAARSRRIVPVSECPVLLPEIVDLFAPLRALLSDCLKSRQEAEVAITNCRNGLDVTLAWGQSLDGAVREKLVAFAATNDLVRISWQSLRRGKVGPPEIVVRRDAPTVTFAGIDVEIPPDAFVQPTAEGEAALRDAILGSVSGTRRVADLYAGCGAFSLPLASTGIHVMAIDSDPELVMSLEKAARQSSFGEFVTAEARDLNRRPLVDIELKSLDAVILDPPRGGAMAQAGQLARSAIPIIVYVSCNPSSFARDARILIDGGFDLHKVTPVDQFLFSAHVELVGIFNKPDKSKF